jgi:hypothetical protein
MKKFFTEKEIHGAKWVSETHLHRRGYEEVYELIFESEGKFYKTFMSVIVDNETDIYDDDCEEVKKITEIKTIETVKWIPVDDNLKENLND